MKKAESQDHDRDGYKKGYPQTDNKKKNDKYWDGWCDFGDGRIVYDKDIAEYAKKHLKLRDRLDIRKVTEAVMYSFSILSGSVEPPKGKNWKF